MPLDSAISRRHILRMLAAGGCFAATIDRAVAGERRIDRLIRQAYAQGPISQRIDFISRALRGTRYRAHTLIGGPHRREKFVVRDDGFDCVTFCETVVAAAFAPDPAEFRSALRAIRYLHSVVAWRARNHYFFEWGKRNVANGLFRPITMPGSVRLEKNVYWHRALGRRHFSMAVIPRRIFMASRHMLRTGDIVGFVTQRPNLDYFHVGLIAFGRDGELLLRHASLSHGRVLDERMDAFVATNHVRYVTLLRPQEPHAAPVVVANEA